MPQAAVTLRDTVLTVLPGGTSGPGPGRNVRVPAHTPIVVLNLEQVMSAVRVTIAEKTESGMMATDDFELQNA
jgi:hypothetical protein